MEKFLAMRIIGGFLDYKDVPPSLKVQVKEELTYMGKEDLTM